MTVQVSDHKASPPRKMPDSEIRWALLERVIASSPLRQAARLRELLTYVGRRSLKDGHDQVHEQEIGCAVFGRPEGYDTALDNIVRTNVSYLRKRIDAYFEAEGLQETLIMEIPRGSYLPVFHYRQIEPPTVPEPPVPVVPAASEMPEAVPDAPANLRQRRWMPTALIAAGAVILALVCGCISLWMQNRAIERTFYPWHYEPSLAAFWSGLLNSNRETDIVMSDAFLKLAQDLTKKSFTLNDYISGDYIRQVMTQEKDPEVLGILNKVSSWRSSNGNHLKLAQRILALDPRGKSIHLYYSRDYSPDRFEQDNVILLGSQLTNPWDELVAGRMNFIPKFDSNDITAITNRTPAAGEQASYSRSDSIGYCVIAYLPNPGSSGKILLIQGTSVESTEAGGDFLLSEDRLSEFQKMLHQTGFPYFEVLLKTSQVRGTALTATIETYRTYPNLR